MKHTRSMQGPMLMLAIALMLAVGCHKAATTGATSSPAVPPGAVNQFDATAYRICADAQAAIESVKADVAAGTVTLTDPQKVILNQLIAHYNTAESLAVAYHTNRNGNADTATLTAALQQLVTDISQVATQINTATTGH
jgi:hypothetical protein